jgi:hypothetical protein
MTGEDRVNWNQQQTQVEDDNDRLRAEVERLTLANVSCENSCKNLWHRLNAAEAALEKIAHHSEGRGCTWDADIARAALKATPSS